MTATAQGRELAALLRNASTATIRNVLLPWPLEDVVQAVVALPLADQRRVLAILPVRAAVAILESLPPAVQRALTAALPPDDLALLMHDMAADDRTLFLSELPALARRPLLTLLPDEERARVEALLAYPPDSVGRLMSTQYVAIRAAWTAQDVLDHVRVHGHDSETLNVLYVIDDDGLLIDDVRMREVILVPPARTMAELVDGRAAALGATDDQRTAIEVFRREDRTALPVVDGDGVLIGIVTIDDVLDAAQELATRDLQRFGGNEALGEPYMAVPVARMIRKRAGWLVVLFLGETLTATAMGFFEEQIARAVVLALFVPLIISSGGNAGSQASTLVIRALALGEITPRDWWRVARRELTSGLSLGAILAAVGFVRIAGWSLFTDLYGPHWLPVAGTVGLTLVGVVVWGTLVGSMLPFAMRRLGVDPATSSAPFVATLVDVTGLVIYFSIAIALLRGSLL
jgi:magnesium transporter